MEAALELVIVLLASLIELVVQLDWIVPIHVYEWALAVWAFEYIRIGVSILNTLQKALNKRLFLLIGFMMHAGLPSSEGPGKSSVKYIFERHIFFGLYNL
jgi:hypothetical protein